MKQRGWRGTTLFFSLLVVMGTTLGVKLYSVGVQPSSTIALPATRTGTTTSTPSPSSTSPSSTAPSSTSATAPAARTIVGNTVQTRYGNVQVQVSLSGTTITKVDVLQVPQESGRDAQIAGYSVPILNKEVLQSQSAKVDSVSGATYTSEGYLRSLQSAIDKS